MLRGCWAGNSFAPSATQAPTQISRFVPSNIAPRFTRAKTGRPPFELVTMLRIHFLQQWFGLSDLAMEEALLGMVFKTPVKPEWRERCAAGTMAS